MTKILEFYFDFGSPTAYLAYAALPAIIERTRATLVYKPVLLGGVFKGASNQSPVMIPAKANWMFKDLARWSGERGTPLNFNPHFPINTLTLMRAMMGLEGDPRAAHFRDAVFKAMWVDAKNLNDSSVLVEVAEIAGVSGGELTALVSDASVKERLKAETEAALARGLFGVPTFFIGETMHFGQDRLRFVEEDLSA